MSNLALGSAVHGAYEQSARWIEAGLAHCEGLELDLWRLALLSLRVRLELDLGAWTDAAATAGLIGAEGPQSAEPRLQALLVLALVRARRGDPETAPLLAEGGDLAAASDPAGMRPWPVFAPRWHGSSDAPRRREKRRKRRTSVSAWPPRRGGSASSRTGGERTGSWRTSPRR